MYLYTIKGIDILLVNTYPELALNGFIATRGPVNKTFMKIVRLIQ